MDGGSGRLSRYDVGRCTCLHLVQAFRVWAICEDCGVSESDVRLDPVSVHDSADSGVCSAASILNSHGRRAIACFSGLLSRSS